MIPRANSILIILVFTFGVTSCEKPTPACGCDDPLEDLPWLKDTLNLYIRADVYSYTHNNVEYIGISTEDYLTSGLVQIFDCAGNYICSYGGLSTNLCEIGLAPRKLLFKFVNPNL